MVESGNKNRGLFLGIAAATAVVGAALLYHFVFAGDEEEESSHNIAAAAAESIQDRALADEVIKTEPVNLLDDDERSIWSGFVTRNK